MWNKNQTSQPQPQPPSAPVTQPPLPQTVAPPRTAVVDARQKAVIGPSMHIKGEIRSDEELVIDGEVEGIVESGSLVTIGRNGKVRANIRAREVVIFGSIKGNIEAIERLGIRDQGSLVGDIKTATISIDDGAYFKGSIDISRPEPKITAKPVKNEAKAG